MNLNDYTEPKPDYVKRIIWTIINVTVFRILIGNRLKILRNVLLRMFGAKIPLRSLVYPSCKIWGPWNLTIGKYSCIGPNTEIYNRAPVVIGDNVVVSQGAYLCTASHDVTDPKHSVVLKKIEIKDRAWVAADAFIGMGVTIGEGAVVGARAAVFKDVEPWTIVGGNPAKVIKIRKMSDENDE